MAVNRVRGQIAQSADLCGYAALDAANTLAQNWQDCPDMDAETRISDVLEVIGVLHDWAKEIRAGTGGEAERAK